MLEEYTIRCDGLTLEIEHQGQVARFVLGGGCLDNQDYRTVNDAKSTIKLLWERGLRVQREREKESWAVQCYNRELSKK